MDDFLLRLAYDRGVQRGILIGAVAVVVVAYAFRQLGIGGGCGCTAPCLCGDYGEVPEVVELEPAPTGIGTSPAPAES